MTDGAAQRRGTAGAEKLSAVEEALG